MNSRLSAVLFLSLVYLTIAFNLTTPLTRSAVKPCPAVSACLRRLDAGKKCAILPVPKRATIPLLQGEPFRLIKLRPGIWAYDDFGFIALIIHVNRRLTIIDPPDSPGSNKPDGGTFFIDGIQKVLGGTTPKRVDMIYTHDHYDHIGGATRVFNYLKTAFPSVNVLIWGTFETRRRIKASTTKRAIPPNVIVGKRGHKLSIGDGIDIKMTIVGGHSGDDLLLYIEPKGRLPGIVILDDIVFPRWSPFLNMGFTEDFGRYIQVHHEILRRDFQIYLGGHFLVGSRADVQENLRFAKDLFKAAEMALASVTQQEIADAGFGRIADPDAREFGNIWFGFIGTVRRLQIERCSRMMIEMWGCRIGGLDLTVQSHCLVAIQFVAFNG